MIYLLIKGLKLFSEGVLLLFSMYYILEGNTHVALMAIAVALGINLTDKLSKHMDDLDKWYYKKYED